MKNNTIQKAGVLVFFNIIALMMIFGMSDMITDMKRIDWRTENFVTVKDVVIDDVSFESDGTNPKDENNNNTTTYKYKMNRILHFTYNGQEYEVTDTEYYTSGDSDYKVELRKNYTDNYVYRVNPSNPREMTKGTSGVAPEAITNSLKMVQLISVLILVIVDLIVVWRWFFRKTR